jgi:branched-chain amino acid transport system ATP-binding protein
MALLEVENLVKSFGGLRAVDDVSLSAEAGKVTALIGPNGAGKTTVFNVVTGFDLRDSGTIRFDGAPIPPKRKPWQVARLGMVRTFQTPVGFPKLTVLENLEVSGSAGRTESLREALAGHRAWGEEVGKVDRRAEELLRELALWERRDVVLEDLSVGENKLLEFARQLINDPRLLMLDEPASGVDPAAIGRLSTLIRRLRDQGLGLLVIDHNLSFILGIADYVYVLAEGAVIAEGPPDEIARHPRVLEIYLGKGEVAA